MNLSEIWHTDNLRPAATDAALDHSEAMLGVTLPRRYRLLLQKHNGGETQRLLFHATLPETFGADHFVVDHIQGVGRGAGEPVASTILDSYRIGRERGLPAKQILLCIGEHWFVTLDYRKRIKSPTVHLFDVEGGTDQPLVGDFDALVKGLTLAKD